jgi:hypothetical protein
VGLTASASEGSEDCCPPGPSSFLRPRREKQGFKGRQCIHASFVQWADRLPIGGGEKWLEANDKSAPVKSPKASFFAGILCRIRNSQTQAGPRVPVVFSSVIFVSKKSDTEDQKEGATDSGTSFRGLVCVELFGYRSAAVGGADRRRAQLVGAQSHMPTIASSNVPPPQSWDEFESIMLSAAKLRWQSSDFYRNGRQGQKQDGVDIWGDDSDGDPIGIQCKNTVDGISAAIVRSEVKKAEAFTPALQRLYIATTAKRDKSLQKEVRDLSKARRAAGQFKVDVLFWEDVFQDLARDDSIFFQHYPQFRQAVDKVKEHDKKLFDELTTLLSSEGVIGFLDRTNMAGFSFREAELEPLRAFYFEWNRPEREFIAPELEALKKGLWNKVDEYYGLYTVETFSTDNPERHTVPPEWEFEQPEHFWRVVNGLHTLAGEIVSLHADFVRKGRAHLIGIAPAAQDD